MTEVPDWWLGPAGIVELVRADEWVRPRGGGGHGQEVRAAVTII